MHDDDLSPLEAAEQIVEDEANRHVAAMAAQLSQISELFEGLSKMVSELVERLQPSLEIAKEIVEYEDNVIAFMDDQMRF